MTALVHLVMVVALLGCGGGNAAAPTGRDAEAPPRRFAEARALFNEICAACHTLADAGAKGRRFNLDTESPITQFLKTDSQRLRLIREAVIRGAPGMPAFGEIPARGELGQALSDRELTQLIDYVAATAGRSSRRG